MYILVHLNYKYILTNDYNCLLTSKMLYNFLLHRYLSTKIHLLPINLAIIMTTLPFHIWILLSFETFPYELLHYFVVPTFALQSPRNVHVDIHIIVTI